jgi:hypothetical protein
VDSFGQCKLVENVYYDHTYITTYPPPFHELDIFCYICSRYILMSRDIKNILYRKIKNDK